MKNMLLHPTVLRLLYEWKVSTDEKIWLDLVALLVDCEQRLDYDELDGIFYEYKKVQRKKSLRVKELKYIVESKFMFGCVFPEETINESMAYFLRDISELRDEVAVLLISMRRNSRRIEKRKQSSSLFLSQKDGVIPKKSVGKSGINMLKFVNMESKRERPCSAKSGLFDPVCFDDSVIVSTFLMPVKSTLRIRKDLQNPRRLIFIKFCCEARPPIRKPRTEKLNVRNSLTRLPQVLDYDYDSDFENEEDVETVCSSEAERKEDEESVCEWIEPDTEKDTDSVKRGKKRRPCLTFPQCKFSIFASCLDAWLLLPIIERDVFPEEHLEEFKKHLENTKDSRTLWKTFGRKYMVTMAAISRKLLELGL